MSESLAPDPKPSCCLSSPMGTCEQHATFSVEEMTIMEMDRRVRSVAADIRAVRDGGCHIDRADLDHWVAMLEGVICGHQHPADHREVCQRNPGHGGAHGNASLLWEGDCTLERSGP